MSGKVFEAKEHCKAAEKAMKTNVFRWKPDYDSAADEYSQAAQCYRIAKDLPNSKECLLKASECFKKNHAFFHAAKSLENAMIVFKEAAPPQEIYNLAMEASSLFQQHGSGDSGASVLDKAAKLLEQTAPELAVKLFQQAADVSSLLAQEEPFIQFVYESESSEEEEGSGDAEDSEDSEDLGDSEDTEDSEDSDDMETSDDDPEDVLEYYNSQVPKKPMVYYRSKVSKEAMEYLKSKLGEDAFAPGVLEKHADGMIDAGKTEPGAFGPTLSKTEREVKAHLAFLNVCKEMGAYYFQAPIGNDEEKEATRELILYMMGYYQSVVEKKTRSYLRHAKEISEFATMIHQSACDLRTMKRAIDVFMKHTESSQHQGSEYISKASRILVKLQWYDQAVDSLRREIGFHQESGNTGAIGRLTVAIVLVQLARGDAVAAEKAYKEWGSNCEVAEMQTLEQILQAYDEEDRESAKRALASPFIRNMDVEYARLAATVPLPEAMEPAPRAAVRENAAPSYVSPNAQSTTTADVSSEQLEESPYEPVTYVKKSDDEDGLC